MRMAEGFEDVDFAVEVLLELSVEAPKLYGLDGDGSARDLVLADKDLGKTALSDLAADDELADDGIFGQAMPPM